MPNQLSPILFMLSSTFSLSLTGLFSKYLGQYFESGLLSLLRFIVPAVIILVMTRRVYTRPIGKLSQAIWLRAFCIAACQVCFIYSLNHLSLMESVVLFGTGPMFLPLLERLIFSTKISWVSLLGLGVTFFGVLLLAGDITTINLRPELLIGLASGLFNAGSQLSLYRISQSNLDAFAINYWTFLGAAMVLSPYVGYCFSTAQQMVDTSEVEPSVLAMAMLALSLFIINTQVFRSKAYRLANSGTQLAPLIFTNLLFSAAWQWLFFEESYNLSQITGITLIIAANMFVVLIPKYLARGRLTAKDKSCA